MTQEVRSINFMGEKTKITSEILTLKEIWLVAMLFSLAARVTYLLLFQCCNLQRLTLLGVLDACVPFHALWFHPSTSTTLQDTALT